MSTSSTDLLDRIANAIGSAHIGAPWTVNDYPESHATVLYRTMARAAYAASGAEAAETLVRILRDELKQTVNRLRTVPANYATPVLFHHEFTDWDTIIAKVPADMGAELARLREENARLLALGTCASEAVQIENKTLRARVAELEGWKKEQLAVEARSERLAVAGQKMRSHLEPRRIGYSTAARLATEEWDAALAEKPTQHHENCDAVDNGPDGIRKPCNFGGSLIPNETAPRFYIFARDYSKCHEYALWWNPKAAGYTNNLSSAGLFSEAEAHANTDRSHGEHVMVPESIALAIAWHRCVDVCNLRAALDAIAHRKEGGS